jgi:hypothetical protein
MNDTSTFQRVASVVDPDGSKIVLWPCADCDTVTLYALSASAGAVLTVRLLGFTGPGNLAAISAPFIFTASTTVDFAGQYSGSPNESVWMPIYGVTLAGVKIDAITGGPWTIGAAVSRQPRR